MYVRYGRHPDDNDDIDAQCKDWETAACMIGMIALVAAAGPDGFAEDELEVALVGAAPNEVVKMVSHAVGSLVEKAWPDELWSE